MVLLAMVLAASLTIRILPISADLPLFSSLDEANYVETALRFGSGAFQLSSFFHGALYQMVLCFGYVGYYVVGRVVGLFSSTSDFLLAYLEDPAPFFLLARMTVALCGLGIVWLSYAIAARAYNSRVGLVASLFTSFSLLMFQMSFLALADIPAVFLLMLATYLTVLSVERPADRRMYCGAAALIGLAAACKYHAGFGIVILYVAAFLKQQRGDGSTSAFVQLALAGSICAAVGFCAGLPQFVLDPSALYRDLFIKLRGQYLGHNPDGRAWLFLFTHHLRNGLGIPLELASLLGLAFAVYKRSQWDALLLSLPIAFYFLFMHSIGFAYHLLPAIPFLLILAARFLDVTAQTFLRRPSLAASLALAVAVASPTSLDSMRLIKVMRTSSTKTLAKTWIEEHVPSGATIMAEGYVFTVSAYGPPLVENRSTLERDMAFIQKNNGTGRTAALRLAHYETSDDRVMAYDIHKVRSMEAETISLHQPRYLVLTSANDVPAGDELAGLFKPSDFDVKRNIVRERIQRQYDVLATISPTAAFTPFFPHLMDEDYRQIREWPLFSTGGSRGPTITVWERRSAG